MRDCSCRFGFSSWKARFSTEPDIQGSFQTGETGTFRVLFSRGNGDIQGSFQQLTKRTLNVRVCPRVLSRSGPAWAHRGQYSREPAANGEVSDLWGHGI